MPGMSNRSLNRARNKKLLKAVAGATVVIGLAAALVITNLADIKNFTYEKLEDVLKSMDKAKTELVVDQAEEGNTVKGQTNDGNDPDPDPVPTIEPMTAAQQELAMQSFLGKFVAISDKDHSDLTPAEGGVHQTSRKISTALDAIEKVTEALTNKAEAEANNTEYTGISVSPELLEELEVLRDVFIGEYIVKHGGRSPNQMWSFENSNDTVTYAYSDRQHYINAYNAFTSGIDKVEDIVEDIPEGLHGLSLKCAFSSLDKAQDKFEGNLIENLDEWDHILSGPNKQQNTNNLIALARKTMSTEKTFGNQGHRVTITPNPS